MRAAASVHIPGIPMAPELNLQSISLLSVPVHCRLARIAAGARPNEEEGILVPTIKK